MVAGQKGVSAKPHPETHSSDKYLWAHSAGSGDPASHICPGDVFMYTQSHHLRPGDSFPPWQLELLCLEAFSSLPTSEFLLFKMLSCNKSTFSKLGRNIPHLFSRLVCGRTNRAHFKLLELQDPQRKFPALIQQPVTKPLFLCK